jgi:DNA-binding response OmpR family regulator
MDARKRILIVDDEEINLEFFDVMLSKLGFAVEKAENGLEALEKVRRFSPDLIVLDNIMPKMSGWEVTKTLKNDEGYREFREVPIIMFSAMDDVKDKVEGFELGVDDYITKPYNFSEVLARIRAVLRNRELFAQIAARETRIALAEKVNDEIHDLSKDFLEGLRDIVVEAEKLADLPPAAGFVKQIKTKATDATKRLNDLNALMAKTAEEREMIKKKEIELKTLVRQFRKGNQQD